MARFSGFVFSHPAQSLPSEKTRAWQGCQATPQGLLSSPEDSIARAGGPGD
jgi:hypothetical protein